MVLSMMRSERLSRSWVYVRPSAEAPGLLEAVEGPIVARALSLGQREDKTWHFLGSQVCHCYHRNRQAFICEVAAVYS